jgi:ribosomal protein S18 acetylase RimI-like enzyme
VIRRAEKEDIPKIYELGNQLHKNYSATNNLEHMFEELYFKIFVAEEDNNVVGFLSITELYETVDILDIFVLEKYRRKKIASRLLNYMMGSVNSNVTLFTLEVASDNKNALGLYGQFGFEVIQKRLMYYDNTDAYLMGRRCKNEE